MKKKRPIRICLTNNQGKVISLLSGQGAFMRLDGPRFGPKEHILLGLGPLINEKSLEHLVPTNEILHENCKVFYLECPCFIKALAEQGLTLTIPKHWEKITLNELPALLAGRAIWWHKQNTHLFSDFWSPILGQVQAKLLRGLHSFHRSSSVYIPGNKQQLLHQEICQAFLDLGYALHVEQDLRTVLITEQPSLYFSVNLRGLDGDGVDFALLQALNIPVAIWFVDNPWHILSSLRLPWWKQARLFVTDASFIPELKKHGASYVYHLPLAAGQHMWKPEKTIDRISTRQALQAAKKADCVFVGRAHFPEHARFFAAAKLDQGVVDEALSLLKAGQRVHFHWWQKRLDLLTWPGHEVRKIGLGAEKCACMQRVMWLRALLEVRAMVIGDSVSWQNFLPEAKDDIFYSNMDYYTELASIYRVAPCVLNVTSLLLPAGLTQRHFDVWAAGGFLLTDKTDGLDIFPPNLVKPICINNASNIVKTLNSLSISVRSELTKAWQEHIKAEHSYVKRMKFVLQCLTENL